MAIAMPPPVVLAGECLAADPPRPAKHRAGDAAPPAKTDAAAPTEQPPAPQAAEQPPAQEAPPKDAAGGTAPDAERAGRWDTLVDQFRRKHSPRGCGPCVLRGPRALAAPPEPERAGAFEFLALPSDIFPLVFRFLHDCELARLSAASKAAYRACLPEFGFRVTRIETTDAARKVDRPRRTVVEEHRKMETLHIALAGSPVMHVQVCCKKGFPRATLKGCAVQ